jgi:hypothetical protein
MNLYTWHTENGIYKNFKTVLIRIVCLSHWAVWRPNLRYCRSKKCPWATLSQHVGDSRLKALINQYQHQRLRRRIKIIYMRMRQGLDRLEKEWNQSQAG